MTQTRFEREPAREFLAEAAKMISRGEKESPLRHNLSTHLSRMFPDMPWWVKDHASRAESSSAFHKKGAASRGFVDALVGATAIEYEKDLGNPAIFDEGLGQMHDYCADLLNKGVPKELIVGVLSDTVRWHAYRVSEIKPLSAVPGSTIYGRAHLTLDEIEQCDLSAAGTPEAKTLGRFLEQYFGRLGARRLNAETLVNDLGFDSTFSKPHWSAVSSLVDTAFSANPKYAALIEKLWRDFISYLGGDTAAGGFDRQTYAGELYILTLAKLICANILSGKALTSKEDELEAILNGTFFQNRGLSNLVEYDYFGWLNAAPHVQALLPVAQAIQEDLLAYDFASPPAEDLFGALMAQLARRSQRLLLGQEWTPSWLAEKLVQNTITKLPAGQEPRLVDMCCGSGAMVVEAVKQAKAQLISKGESADSPGALTKLSEAITGFDIDPLAVMLAKVSWVLAARDWLDPARPVSIPVYHADSLFAATPLTKVLDDGGVEHHRLLLDDQEVALPAFLISPERQPLFDTLLDSGYAVAMASAKSSASGTTPAVVDSLVHHAESSTGCSLTLDEKELIRQFANSLLAALEMLQRAGRNGIWAFVLRNSYRPGLLGGKFNGLVSNPPWLALSKIAENPYTDVLRRKASDYSIKPPGPSHLHIEMATIFLLHAVERYLIEGAAVGCVLPANITSAHHHNPFRAASYATAKRRIHLRVDGLWRIEKGTFKNEAVVLFGSKSGPASTGDIPGLVVTKDSANAVTFKRIVRGSRTAWSENKALGDKNSGFFKPADFRQGADVMPRTLVFHSLAKAGVSSWNVSPILTNSQERYLKADAKTHKSFSLAVNGLSDSVIFDVLLSHHLTPFNMGDGAKGLLPITRKTGAWSPLSPAEIAVKGQATDNAFKSVLGALGGSATLQTYFDRIETDRKKLTNQAWGEGWLVFMGAGGSNVCAAYAPASSLPPTNTVIDQTLYWTEVATEEEAVYLTGLLNSTSINQVIREFQPVGQFGERHIHKLPLGVTPPYDSTNPAHVDVVAATQRLLDDWRAYKAVNEGTVTALLNPNNSKLHIRRRRIKEILASLPSWEYYENSCKAIYCVA
jgi:hypothetical protein